MAGFVPSSGLSMESTDIALFRSLVPGGEDRKIVVQQDIFQVISICGKALRGEFRVFRVWGKPWLRSREW